MKRSTNFPFLGEASSPLGAGNSTISPGDNSTVRVVHSPSARGREPQQPAGERGDYKSGESGLREESRGGRLLGVCSPEARTAFPQHPIPTRTLSMVEGVFSTTPQLGLFQFLLLMWMTRLIQQTCIERPFVPAARRMPG